MLGGERLDVTVSERGKWSVGRDDVTDCARVKVVGGDRLEFTDSTRRNGVVG